MSKAFGHGGKREGAGRPAGMPNEATIEQGARLADNWFQDPRSEIEKLKEKLQLLLAEKIANKELSLPVSKIISDTDSISDSKEVNKDKNDLDSITDRVEGFSDPGTELGDVVTILYMNSRDDKVFSIVSGQESPVGAGTLRLLTSAPLFEAIEGCEEGEEASYLVDQKQQTVQILSVIKP